MARLPFNPDRVPAPPPTTPPGGERSTTRGPAPLTVTQLSALIKDVLANAMPGKVRVVGEISNFSQRAHWFFSLKDDGACIPCVCFASAARKVAFPVTDGMQVVLTGRLDYYDAQGKLQLYVDAIEPVGQGALELRYRALCDELRKLGYFDEARKKPLPVMPTRVAVITSRSAAALQDVINTAQRRWAGCELLLFDVRVQGGGAAPEIAAALDALSKHGPRLGVDAIILTRGGGSIEDLWAFNERVVADAIFRCPLPVVAAIGHETDTTVAELVADARCSTPTQAAMTLIPDRATLQQQVRQLSGRLAQVLRRQAEMSRERLLSIQRHTFFRRPMRHIEPARDRLNQLTLALEATLPRRVRDEAERLQQASRQLRATLPRRLGSATHRLAALERQLQSVGPMNVLQRGYSITLAPDGHVLRRAADATPGQRITSVLADGRIQSDVVNPSTPPAPSAPPPQRGSTSKRIKTTRRRHTGIDDLPTLFNAE